MKLQPVADYLIVKAIEDTAVSASGIVLPDTIDKDKPERGEVIAVGPGKILDSGARAEMSVKAGQKIMFRKYAPDEVKIDGEDLLVIRETDVMAIIE